MERASSFPCSKPAFNSMTSNANSNAANPPGSRYFTVRFAKAIGRLLKRLLRFTFSRRMVWTLAILVSLVVLFYQYENWNGTREIAAAREQLQARVGTTDPMALLPVEVPEADNFFANPVFKSWRVANPRAAGGFEMNFPDGPQVSKEMIAQLAQGLDRPSSQLIPCRRRCISEAGGDVIMAGIPSFSGAYRFQEELARQLSLSAQAGDAVNTFHLIGIMLRLGEAFSTEPELVVGNVGLALHEVALRTLNDGLRCAMFTDLHYSGVQQWLARDNDLDQVEKTFENTALHSGEMLAIMKRAALNNDLARYFGSTEGRDEEMWLKAIRHGPVGWFDTSGAFAVSQLLIICGDGGPENWRSGHAAIGVVGENTLRAAGVKITGDFWLPNFRRMVGCLVIPNVSNVWKMAAQNLVKRRCAILTCALHRQRLLHGSYPASLTDLDASLLPSPQPDPARAEAPMNYRLTDKGFLLWSVGMDRVDDGGDAEKDWVWRHEPVKAVIK
jgi:hypothetical protein